jgi:hypothetical protein
LPATADQTAAERLEAVDRAILMLLRNIPPTADLSDQSGTITRVGSTVIRNHDVCPLWVGRRVRQLLPYRVCDAAADARAACELPGAMALAIRDPYPFGFALDLKRNIGVRNAVVGYGGSMLAAAVSVAVRCKPLDRTITWRERALWAAMEFVTHNEVSWRMALGVLLGHSVWRARHADLDPAGARQLVADRPVQTYGSLLCWVLACSASLVATRRHGYLTSAIVGAGATYVGLKFATHISQALGSWAAKSTDC